jgi:DNA-binding IclR family transcriptional regulator
MAKARQEAPETAKVVEAAGGVQSLHRAFAILQAVVQARRGIGLAELCKEVGLHTSTAFHLAKTLVTLGIIRQEPDTKRYRVGARLFSLASGALDERELLDVAMPVLTSLAEETGESTHMAVLAGHEIYVIGRCDGTASIRLAERVGTARPPHATALGKMLLSALPPVQLEKLVGSIELTAITPRTIVDPELLKAEIANVARNGIAFDDCEFDANIRCLAAPVYDFRGKMIAAISISAPMWRMGLNKVGDVSAIVVNSAKQLSALLGYSEQAEEPKGKSKVKAVATSRKRVSGAAAGR